MPSPKYYSDVLVKGLRTIELDVSRPTLKSDASPLQFGSFTAYQSAVEILFNISNWSWYKFIVSVHSGVSPHIQIYRGVWNTRDCTMCCKACNMNMNYARRPLHCRHSQNPQLISPFSRLFMNPTVTTSRGLAPPTNSSWQNVMSPCNSPRAGGRYQKNKRAI